MLGAMIDWVLWLASHTRRKTGMTPNVLPSLGSVEYTGSGIRRVFTPAGQLERGGRVGSASSTWAAAGSDSRQALSRAITARIIENRGGPPAIGIQWMYPA